MDNYLRFLKLILDFIKNNGIEFTRLIIALFIGIQPNVYSIIAVLISIIALVISYLAYRESRRSRRSSIFTELMQQMNIINESTVKYRIKGPYAVLLGIEDSDEIIEHERSGIVFFHHLNLLYIVYKNKDYLDKNTVLAYEKWVKDIFAPWLRADQRIENLWKK